MKIFFLNIQSLKIKNKKKEPMKSAIIPNEDMTIFSVVHSMTDVLRE